jgi:hypothetical protein
MLYFLRGNCHLRLITPNCGQKRLANPPGRQRRQREIIIMACICKICDMEHFTFERFLLYHYLVDVPIKTRGTKRKIDKGVKYPALCETRRVPGSEESRREAAWPPRGGRQGYSPAKVYRQPTPARDERDFSRREWSMETARPCTTVSLNVQVSSQRCSG